MIRDSIEKGTKVFNVSLGFGIFEKWAYSYKSNPILKSPSAIVVFNNRTYFVPRTELTEIEE